MSLFVQGNSEYGTGRDARRRLTGGGMVQAQIVERFTTGPLPHWVRMAVGPAEVTWDAGRLRLVVNHALATQLANAEMGDYRARPRAGLPWSAPLRLAVRARFSHPASQLGGTSGFGFWNDPFDLASGDVLAPPNALWFFCASASSDMVTAPGLPGNGFLAQTINSGTMPTWLVAVGSWLLRLPGLTPLLYRAAQARVHAAAVQLVDVEITTWHDYVLCWHRSEAVFSVDSQEVLRAPQPPQGRLGFVAWMDNQLAVVRPDGEFRFGLEAVPQQQWLELDQVEIETR